MSQTTKMKITAGANVEPGDIVDLFLLNPRTGRIRKRTFRVSKVAGEELDMIEMSRLNRMWHWIWYKWQNLLR